MESLLCGELANLSTKEDVGEVFQLCWAIWKARNEWVFNGYKPNPRLVISAASQANIDYIFALFAGAEDTHRLL